MEVCYLCGHRTSIPELPTESYQGNNVHSRCKQMVNWRFPQHEVTEFHIKFGVLIGRTPQIPSLDTTYLRYQLIHEESDELLKAIQNEDLVEIADGIADVMYVILGTGVSYGINMKPIWDEVQRTNMLKEGGATREDGKILKPEGWVPPDIKNLLIKQGAVL